MARVCQVTGKRTVRGNNRSRSMKATRRFFLPNVHARRIWMGRGVGFVRLRLSAKGMRIIDRRILGEIITDRKTAKDQ